MKELAAAHPADPAHRRELAVCHFNLGVAWASSGRRQEGKAELQQALKLRQELAEVHPAVAQYRHDLARSYLYLGSVEKDGGRAQEAFAAWQKALALLRPLVAEHPAVAEYRLDLATCYDHLEKLYRAAGRLQDVAATLRNQLEHRQKLADDHPGSTFHANNLGGIFCNLGQAVSQLGQPQEGLDTLGRAAAVLEGVLRKEPKDVTARLFLRNTHQSRAEVLKALGRHAEAERDWDRAIDLDTGPSRTLYQLLRAVNRAYLGRHGQATADVEEVLKAGAVPPGYVYGAGCVYAVAAGVVKDEEVAERYARRAVALLRQALDRGYPGGAFVRKNPDLGPLRQRDDFRQLLAELEAKSGKKAN
jgi:tetratricopeptide (TPR) repeat protein